MSDQMDEGSIQQLREAADRGTSAVKEAEALRKELTLTKAGINLDTPLGAMFAKSYDGDLDVAKVQEAWAQVAPAPSAPAAETPPPPASTPAELEETEARRLLTSGGAGDTPNEPPPVDQVGAGFEQFHERMAGGARREVAAQSVISGLIGAANEGDPRAVWNGWTEEELGQDA